MDVTLYFPPRGALPAARQWVAGPTGRSTGCWSRCPSPSRLASVHWGMAGRIVRTWSFTLPCAAVVGAAASWLAASGTTGRRHGGLTTRGSDREHRLGDVGRDHGR